MSHVFKYFHCRHFVVYFQSLILDRSISVVKGLGLAKLSSQCRGQSRIRPMGRPLGPGSCSGLEEAAAEVLGTWRKRLASIKRRGKVGRDWDDDVEMASADYGRSFSRLGKCFISRLGSETSFTGACNALGFNWFGYCQKTSQKRDFGIFTGQNWTVPTSSKVRNSYRKLHNLSNIWWWIIFRWWNDA